MARLTSEGTHTMSHPYQHAVSSATKFGDEQHVLEDLGRIPTVQDWLGKIQPEPWMLGRDRGQVSE